MKRRKNNRKCWNTLIFRGEIARETIKNGTNKRQAFSFIVWEFAWMRFSFNLNCRNLSFNGEIKCAFINLFFAIQVFNGFLWTYVFLCISFCIFQLGGLIRCSMIKIAIETSLNALETMADCIILFSCGMKRPFYW